MSPGGHNFVLFPIGKKRFALPAATVTELARPDRVQAFPHTSPLLIGVLERRGHIVAVCDIAPLLIGPNAPPRKFYLIANRKFASGTEWTAIPVTGECELTSADMIAPTGKLPPYVAGLLSFESEIVEVLDFEKLVATEVPA